MIIWDGITDEERRIAGNNIYKRRHCRFSFFRILIKFILARCLCNLFNISKEIDTVCQSFSNFVNLQILFFCYTIHYTLTEQISRQINIKGGRKGEVICFYSNGCGRIWRAAAQYT